MCACVCLSVCLSKRVIACGVSAPTTGFGSPRCQPAKSRVNSRVCVPYLSSHARTDARTRTVAVGAAYASLVSRRHARDRQREERRRARSPERIARAERRRGDDVDEEDEEDGRENCNTVCSYPGGGLLLPFRRSHPFRHPRHLVPAPSRHFVSFFLSLSPLLLCPVFLRSFLPSPLDLSLPFVDRARPWLRNAEARIGGRKPARSR